MIDEDGTVPPIFRASWARLNCDLPTWVSQHRWWNAIVAGGLLLDAWGGRVEELGWQVDDLFSIDAGLVWSLADNGGSAVTSIDKRGANITTTTGDHRRHLRRWTQ